VGTDAVQAESTEFGTKTPSAVQQNRHHSGFSDILASLTTPSTAGTTASSCAGLGSSLGQSPNVSVSRGGSPTAHLNALAEAGCGAEDSALKGTNMMNPFYQPSPSQKKAAVPLSTGKDQAQNKSTTLSYGSYGFDVDTPSPASNNSSARTSIAPPDSTSPSPKKRGLSPKKKEAVEEASPSPNTRKKSKGGLKDIYDVSPKKKAGVGEKRGALTDISGLSPKKAAAKVAVEEVCLSPRTQKRGGLTDISNTGTPCGGVHVMDLTQDSPPPSGVMSTQTGAAQKSASVHRVTPTPPKKASAAKPKAKSAVAAKAGKKGKAQGSIKGVKSITSFFTKI